MRTRLVLGEWIVVFYTSLASSTIVIELSCWLMSHIHLSLFVHLLKYICFIIYCQILSCYSMVIVISSVFIMDSDPSCLLVSYVLYQILLIVIKHTTFRCIRYVSIYSFTLLTCFPLTNISILNLLILKDRFP